MLSGVSGSVFPSTSAAATDRCTVAIIDDHDVVHAGVAAWCAQAEPPIGVLGCFRSPMEFLARYPNPPHDVDLVVLEPHIAGGRPDFGSLQRLCRASQRVIVYSQLCSDEVILTSLECGAISYLAKTEGRHHLLAAIRAAKSGEPYLGPLMAKALLHDHASGRPRLSDREKQVLVAWFRTESKELVGAQLCIAPTTVRTHLQRVRAKYAAAGRDAPSKAALLARAVEDGILGLDELLECPPARSRRVG